MVVDKITVAFGVRFIRVPYYIGDLNRDPNVANYPYCSTTRNS